MKKIIRHPSFALISLLHQRLHISLRIYEHYFFLFHLIYFVQEFIATIRSTFTALNHVAILILETTARRKYCVERENEKKIICVYVCVCCRVRDRYEYVVLTEITLGNTLIHYETRDVKTTDDSLPSPHLPLYHRAWVG